MTGAQLAQAEALCREHDLLASGEAGEVHPVGDCRCRWCSMTRGMRVLLGELAEIAQAAAENGAAR